MTERETLKTNRGREREQEEKMKQENVKSETFRTLRWLRPVRYIQCLMQHRVTKMLCVHLCVCESEQITCASDPECEIS